MLAACKHHLRPGHIVPTDDVGLASLLSQDDEKSDALSTLALNRQSTIWLTWLEETELRLALRVLLAPASAFGRAHAWEAALARQSALTARFARVARLHEALAWRLGNEKAVARLEYALARLAQP